MKTQRGVRSQKPRTWPCWHPGRRLLTSVSVRSGCLLFINQSVCCVASAAGSDREPAVSSLRTPRASHWSVDRLRGQARWAWSALFCTASCVEKVTNKQSFWERSKECCDWHCPDRFILVSLGLDKCLACLENNAKESFFHQRPNVAAFNRHNISSKTEIRADKRATISLLLWKQNELYLSEINPLNEISGRIHSPENMTEKIIHYYLCI